MKTVIAAFAAVATLLAVAMPASAGYTAPDASYVTKAFTHGIP